MTISIPTPSHLALAGLVALGSFYATADGAERWPRCLPFTELSIVLEQNATDGDAEVVIFAKGQDEGLSELSIRAPNGRSVAHIVGSRRGVGLREFVIESAEPPDLPRILASFPAGTYSFLGRTVGGDFLRGSAVLSHAFAPAATILTPADEEIVPIDHVVLSWAAVPGAEVYIVELTNEALGNEYRFEILPPTTSLAVPAAMLADGTEYLYGVAVKAADGNITSVETTFFTGASPTAIE